MSKAFIMAVVAALLVVPTSAAVTRAEESKPESKQTACEQGKDCPSKKCCKDGKCDLSKCEQGKCADGECTKSACSENKCKQASCKKGECTACKCDNCENASCDKSNCACEQSTTGVTAVVYTGCAKGDCATSSDCKSKGCCKDGKCDKTACAETSCQQQLCYAEGNCASDCGVVYQESSAFRFAGHSLLDGSVPSSLNFDVVGVFGFADEYQLISRNCDEDCCNKKQLQVAFAAASEDNSKAMVTAYTEPECKACTKLDSAAKIMYSVRVIEDREGCLREFEAVRDGKPIMAAESKTLLPAMRVLEKNDLIRQISSPKVVCELGQPAQMVAWETSEGELWLKLTSHCVEDGLVVDMGLGGRESLSHVDVKVASGQSYVVNLNCNPAEEGHEAISPAVYIVVTPEVIE